MPPELELKGTERIFVGPFLLEPRVEGGTRQVDVNAPRELERYVRTVIRRRTRLTLLEPSDDISPPTRNPSELVGMPEFWTEVSRETGADYIVAAFVDVEVLDREGYTTEKYVSPEDGKTYFRQVLVEETGFDYDILFHVYDASGTLVLEEQVTEFKDRSQRKLNEFKDMFDDLYKLENRVLGMFVPRTVRAKRFLYGG